MPETVELSDEVKRFIVQELACWSSPSDVAKAVKEDFGLEITRQRVQTYDPTKAAGKALGPELKAIFEKTRAEYLTDTAQIGIAQKTFRLRMLERMAAKAEGSGNMALAAQLCEQAAKEMGNAYTNKRELSGPNGGPIQTQEMHDLSDEQLAAIAAGGGAGTASPAEGQK